MKIPSFPIALLFLAGITPLLHAQGNSKSVAAVPALEWVVELADGSRVIGTPSVDRLQIKNKYATLNFQLSKTRAIEFSGANHFAKVDLQNGDELKGQLAAKEIAVKTASGKLTLPVAKMSRIFVQFSSMDRDFVNSLGLKFITVPGTRVLFSIWDTRVEDFEKFVKETGHEWPKPDFEQGPTHPAVNVSWDDAKAFCLWLTQKERKEGKIGPDQEYRLPTDEEWSVAVGLKGETGNTPAEKDRKIEGVYPWGTQWPPPKGVGNYAPYYKVDDYEHTSPVGSFAANQYGLYDMGGNIWQWCEDFYDTKHPFRVMRGVSFADSYPGSELSSCRRPFRPATRREDYGFRVVLSGGIFPVGMNGRMRISRFSIAILTALVILWLQGGNCSADIVTPKAPKGGREIVYANADTILKGLPRFMGGLRVENLNIADPHQGYVVGLNDLRAGRLLSAAKLSTWRYLLICGNNVVGEVSLNATKDSEGRTLDFNSLDPSGLDTEILEAERKARELPQVKRRDYELRYLDIAGTCVAVWLHNKTDDIIILLPSTWSGKPAYRPYSESEILKMLRKYAKSAPE